MKGKLYLIYTNPNMRPKDHQPDLLGPMVENYLTGLALALVIADATVMWWSNFYGFPTFDGFSSG